MVDSSQIERVWDLLQRDRASIKPTPLLHWFAVGGGERAGDYASSPRELVQAARTCQGMGMNFYLQLNPSSNRVRMRARSEDVTHWMYLLMDVDPQEKDADPLMALVSFEWELWKQMGYERPHVIDSGRGFQAWFPFQPMEIGNRGPEFVAAHSWWLNSFGKSHGCVLDPAVADLPRIMRCPGTTNIKSGRIARLVQEGEVSDSIGYRLLGMAPKWEPPPPRPSVPGRPWQSYIPSLTFSAMRFLSQGASKGNRHNAAVQACKSLFELGCGEDQARRALEWGSHLSEETLESEEIEQVLRSVYRRGVV